MSKRKEIGHLAAVFAECSTLTHVQMEEAGTDYAMRTHLNLISFRIIHCKCTCAVLYSTVNQYLAGVYRTGGGEGPGAGDSEIIIRVFKFRKLLDDCTT